MPGSGQLVYIGGFRLAIPYALGNVVTIGVDWIEFPGVGLSRRAKSIGGSYVCGTPVQNYSVYDTMAIRGETARQDMIGQQWVDIPVPGRATFAPLFPPTAVGTPGRGVTWRGVWTSNTSYSSNDLVSRNFAVYIATQGVTPLDPAPDAVAGSPKWSPLIPRTTPTFRGTWDKSTPYNTGDLVQYTIVPKVNMYSLTRDTSAGSYTNTTAPNEDQGNWQLVLDFLDPATAAWLSGAATAMNMLVTLGNVVGSTIQQRNAAAAGLADAMDAAVRNSVEFREIASKLTNLRAAWTDVTQRLVNLLAQQ